MRPFGNEYAESPRWNNFERFYIRIFGLVDLSTRMRSRLVLKELLHIPRETMIDLGCGTGAYSFYFSRFPETRVWGIDTHKGRLSECERLGQKLNRKSLNFIQASRIFENNRFQPNSIDVVLAVEVLQYLDDFQHGLVEIHQVLKPGGYLIAHIPLLGYMRKPETVLFDEENLSHWIREAGLEPISIKRVFGKTAVLLSRIFAYCLRSRLAAAAVFPFLLMASLPCGGTSARGSYCLAVARKP